LNGPTFSKSIRIVTEKNEIIGFWLPARHVIDKIRVYLNLDAYILDAPYLDAYFFDANNFDAFWRIFFNIFNIFFFPYDINKKRQNNLPSKNKRQDSQHS
jgi:hypothetical protein